MRLTLRTLLAYADDILEPAQAREIGQKLQESEVARELLQRIKDVMRRRRLGAPDVSGPDMGLDPNTVAEYLDNTLSPTSVADVERICLESDLHLAEVAASHQILTLVLGEAVNVPEERRERAYALGPLTKAPQLEAAEQPAAKSQPESSKFESQLPDYLREDYERRNAPLRKALPFLVVGGVACLWFALVYFDPSLNPFGRPAANPGGEQVAANGEEGTPESDENGGNPGDGGRGPEAGGNDGAGTQVGGVGGNNIGSGEPATTEVGGGENPMDGLPPVAGINPPPPDDEPGTGNTPPVEVAGAPGGTKPPAGVGENVPVPPREGEVKPEPPAAPMPEPTSLIYEAISGVLVHTVEEQETIEDEEVTVTNWKLLPKRSVIHAGEGLACPEPFESSLVVPRLLKIEMLGGSRLRARATPEGAVASFELERGRVVVERTGGDPRQPVDCEFVVHGRRYALRLDASSRCGIAVDSTDRNGFPLGPTGYEEPFDPTSRPAALYVVKGQCQLVALDLPPRGDGEAGQNDGRSVLLRQPNYAVSLMPDEWPLEAPGAVPLLPMPAAPVMPDWLAGGRRILSSALRQARIQFEREFGLADTVQHSIEPIVKDDDPDISMYAVRTMDLIGAEDALVNALAMAPHAEARQAAVVGLRTWMTGQSPKEVAARLRTEFPRYFPEQTAEDVYRLLWGFDAEDARNPVTSQLLVGWLNDEEEAIRHLAFFHVRRLTGRDFDYQPHARTDVRESSVGRWLRFVNETGALLPPEPVAP